MLNYTQIFKGTAFSSKSSSEVQILKDYLFFINAEGIIEKTVAPIMSTIKISLLHTKAKKIFIPWRKVNTSYQALSICMYMHHSGHRLVLH